LFLTLQITLVQIPLVQRYVTKNEKSSSLTLPRDLQHRVARWFVFKPKIQIWVNFGGPQHEKCLYVLWPSGIIYSHLVKFMFVWYSLWSFGIFFPFWYVWTKKNLATLLRQRGTLGGPQKKKEKSSLLHMSMAI
jgi:hypothetical protein